MLMVCVPFPVRVKVRGIPVVLSVISEINTVITAEEALSVMTIVLLPTIGLPLIPLPCVFGAVCKLMLVSEGTLMPLSATVKLFSTVPIEF